MTVISGENAFDIALDYGKAGEAHVDDMLRHLYEGTTCEVKRDSRCLDTGNIYVEYECRGRDGIWRKSGIATSEASLWAFVFSDTGVVLLFPTQSLRYIAREAWKVGANRASQPHGENPTRGVLLNLARLPRLVGELPWQVPQEAPTDNVNVDRSVL